MAELGSRRPRAPLLLPGAASADSSAPAVREALEAELLTAPPESSLAQGACWRRQKGSSRLMRPSFRLQARATCTARWA